MMIRVAVERKYDLFIVVVVRKKKSERIRKTSTTNVTTNPG
jgi:hypothetical protein